MRDSRPLQDIRLGFPTTPGYSVESNQNRSLLPTTPGPPGGPPDHSRTSGRSSRPLPDIREVLPTTPGHPEGPPDHSRTPGRASRPLADIREGLTTTPGHAGGPPDHSWILGRVVSKLLTTTDHSRTSRRASRPLPNIRESLPTTPRHPGGLLERLPDIWEGVPTTPGHSDGIPYHSWIFGRVVPELLTTTDHSRTSGRVSRSLPVIREGLPTTADIRNVLLTTHGHPRGPPDHSQTSGRAF